MAPGVIKEDSVGLPFKSKKSKLKATVSAENTLSESIIHTASPSESSYGSHQELQTRINNKWNNFHNTITESDVNDIMENGYMYFGDILILHVDAETQFAYDYIGDFDTYRIGSQKSDVYEAIGVVYESMSKEAVGIFIRNNHMYEFIEEMFLRYTTADLMSASDSFIFDEFICINLN